VQELQGRVVGRNNDDAKFLCKGLAVLYKEWEVLEATTQRAEQALAQVILGIRARLMAMLRAWRECLSVGCGRGACRHSCAANHDVDDSQTSFIAVSTGLYDLKIGDGEDKHAKVEILCTAFISMI